MTARQRLKGRRVAVLAADGFEKVELSIPVKALKLEGAKVDVISLRHGRIRGVNLHEPASRVHVDSTVREADPNDYDALFIPGGFINPDLLRQSADAREFVRAFDMAKKPIASLCHGPWVLASSGLLEDRTMTSWPGIRDDVVNAGATWVDEEVVRDRNLLTSRGPQDMVPFVRELINFFEARESTRSELATPAVMTSSPQRNQPPAMMLKAMRWMPRPSLRTAFAMIGMAALGVLALGRRLA
ncbi:MAG: intracellular protease, PfpI family [Myxococcales bacterium]|nr:intracellular protease, PfpI family [Myxococcales bacterium]